MSGPSTVESFGDSQPRRVSRPPVPGTEEFTTATLIVPVVTETDSLKQTIDTVMSTTGEDVSQILLVVCPKTTAASLAECKRTVDELGGVAVVYEQRRPFLGNAIREAFDLATGSHVVMMASDLETDPRTLPLLIGEAKERPNAVITASRWMSGRSFTDYGPIRVGLNFTFQSVAQLLYQTSLTDLTFGYRLFPTKLVQAIRWEDERHNFLLETILKPIRLNVPVVEVPTTWRPRPEGESQNNLAMQAEYIGTLLRCRLRRRDQILSPISSAMDARAQVASS
jgi:hypothetical protein